MIEFVTTDEMNLAAHWNSFCDDGPVPPGFKSWNAFIDRMHAAGLAKLRVAPGEGAAINRPVEWALTDKGQSAFNDAHANNGP